MFVKMTLNAFLYNISISLQNPQSKHFTSVHRMALFVAHVSYDQEN